MEKNKKKSKQPQSKKHKLEETKPNFDNDDVEIHVTKKDSSISSKISKKQKISNESVSKELVIVTGSYEKAVFGYTLLKKGSDQQEANSENNENGDDDKAFSKAGYKLQPLFVSMDHESCIKAIGAQDYMMASSSTDETMKLYDLKKKIEIATFSTGSIPKAEGVVSNICFYGGTHMLTSTEKGHITFWRTKDWQCLVTLQGHNKGPVLGLDIHPSGKLALSTGKDKSLFLWNLVKGKCAFQSKLEFAGEYLKFSPDGNHYVVGSAQDLHIYSTDSGNELRTINTKVVILCFTFVSDKIIAVGGEGNSIKFFDFEKSTLLHEFEAHQKRIKGFTMIEDDKLVSISSDGFVKVWNVNPKNIKKVELIAEHSSTARLTVVASTKVNK